MNRRFGADGVTCNSVHPGAGLYTGLGRQNVSRATARLLEYTLIPLLAPLPLGRGLLPDLAQRRSSRSSRSSPRSRRPRPPEDGLYLNRHWRAEASRGARDPAACAWVWDETQRLLREVALRDGLDPAIALT